MLGSWAKGSGVSTGLAPLVRNPGVPGGPRSVADRGRRTEGVALGCGASVAGRRRRADLRDEGWRQLGTEGAGSIMQINANEHLSGAGTAWALLGPELQSPRAGGAPEAKRSVSAGLGL